MPRHKLLQRYVVQPIYDIKRVCIHTIYSYVQSKTTPNIKAASKTLTRDSHTHPEATFYGARKTQKTTLQVYLFLMNHWDTINHDDHIQWISNSYKSTMRTILIDQALIISPFKIRDNSIGSLHHLNPLASRSLSPSSSSVGSRAFLPPCRLAVWACSEARLHP